jgi:hypothetical protein
MWQGLETGEKRALESFHPFHAEPQFYIYCQYTNIVFILQSYLKKKVI